ncbi:GNAT family N-acetyltransferase [Pelomonas sp. SE-A7]|uniref:GNAT family N-acetyltransferase n=1 Tax=Pelomonas sp. SE-A7 TaxID=3054953 RepID=UPI00259CFDFA|nr:GNAT family N-acetyltransferase [Pelomonas sp. SE-A7]MDM4765857.1 GNAT family N-acetyltransferase [Pelomonas sp. SE-A7]
MSKPAPDRLSCLLRVMREDDLRQYKQLRDSMLERFEEAFTSDAESERSRSAESYRSRLGLVAGGHNLFTLTAWLGEHMVGAISAEFDPRAKVRHIAHIVGMMVSPEMQGMGLGRALLEQALQMLEAEPALEMVTLSVSASNSSAVALYERCGFRRYGRLERAIKLGDGRYVTKDQMSRVLRQQP